MFTLFDRLKASIDDQKVCNMCLSYQEAAATGRRRLCESKQCDEYKAALVTLEKAHGPDAVAILNPLDEALSALPTTTASAGTGVSIEDLPSEPISFSYIRNPESSIRWDATGFGRNVEPAGRYLLNGSGSGTVPDGWESGEVSFKKPLMIEWGPVSGGYDAEDNWKNRLSAHYGGLFGRELTDALVADGYDAVYTFDECGPSEIVDLRAVLSSDAPVQVSEYAEPVTLPNGALIKRFEGVPGVLTEDYRISHRAPSREDEGGSLVDLSETYPTDPRGHFLKQPDWYGGTHEATIKQLRTLHGVTADPRSQAGLFERQVAQARVDPDASVTIYRAVSPGVTSINRGDWVALSEDYALEHAESLGVENGQAGSVLRMTVKARDLFNEGDLEEWGFDPEV